MKVKFNFELRAYVKDIEIEADSYEEAEQQLLGMDIAELIANGYIKESDLIDIDGTVIEDNETVRVFNMRDSDGNLLEDNEKILNIVCAPGDEYTAIDDRLMDEPVAVDSFDYEVLG